MDMDMVLGATSPGVCPQTQRSVCGRNCGGARDPGPWHTGQWSPPVEARPQSAPSQLTAYINTGNILRWTTFTRIFPRLPSRRELFMHVCMTCVYV